MKSESVTEENKLEYWFELSYSSFLTMPRVLLHEMPVEWQNKMTELLEEYDNFFPNMPDIGTRVQITDLNGKLIKTPQWIINYRHPDREAVDKLKSSIVSINIGVTKGCGCFNVGTHKNQVAISTPKYMMDIDHIRWYKFRSLIDVDACLYNTIKELWKAEIVTTGCCCGHNVQDGYIGVYGTEEDVKRAEEIIHGI